MSLSIIAALSSNRVIGSEGDLPWHFPSDLKFFKKMTNGQTIIMGRKTFESLPGMLPNRRHIVVTRGQLEGVETASSIEEAVELAKGDAFIIGGAQIYGQTLDKVDKLYLTLIDATYEGDTFFPEFNWDNFDIEQESSIYEKGVKLTFVEASRKRLPETENSE